MHNVTYMGVGSLLPFNGNAPLSESDKRLVESLYDKYRRLMLYVANQMLGDYAMAEDAVSESLIKMIRHRENYVMFPVVRRRLTLLR